MQPEPTISIVIPTYGREQILLDTIAYHLDQASRITQFGELIVIDQTRNHEVTTDDRLNALHAAGRIRWIRCQSPHLTRSMNLGLLEARSEIVLYSDDDVIPAPGWIVAHLHAHVEHPQAWAVVGQILQPLQEPVRRTYLPKGGELTRFLDFPFNSTEGQFIENAMAGNLSLKKNLALKVGGFDENFPPPVASRFESEFAKRMVKSGGRIWFEPQASLRHLAARTGGTRAQGGHLNSISPCHGIGDCYFALRVGTGFEKWWYFAKKPFREVRTRFHLTHPWWIPLKLIGEFRAQIRALILIRKRPKLIGKFH